MMAMSGLTTVNGATIPANFTTGAGSAAYLAAFGAGIPISAVSVGGSYSLTGPAAVTGSGLAVTLTGASAIAFSGTDDTVTAGGSTPYTAFLGTGSVLNEGSGQSTVYASAGAATVNAGSGSTTVDGGSGSLLFTAGSSSNDSVTAGSGNTSIIGGSGGSDTYVGGTGSFSVTLTGASTDDEVTGTSGNTTVDASASTGPLQITTNPLGNSGTLVATLGTGADTVIGGSGSSVITAGSGHDVFGFVNGYSGGSETISGFNALDNLAFKGYTAPPTEQYDGSSKTDIMTLSDGTKITFLNVDGKIF
jgi:Ca2+-binding RTX toxin-like protein